ncbi:hypothetical protein [Methylocystis bryophila]|uniref:Uncharacterized protein n=1 Tax=Methylocystis bryophila TaxID=655015 RepID=A0A1W6MQY5_9HYPH|nr:hypothetical protein [Methylocystis bryophila]ARN80011.1 hypothetical protein B1812_01750 [Methylocystis bryophila]BDV39922.1 hypothetical protein DSM21852_31750 [Methylocystis bryophila]
MSSTATGLFQRFWNLNWKLKIFVVLIAPITIFVVGLLLLDSFNYAVGERTGVISKLSQKGIACWTWEGQLAQPNFARSSAFGSGRNSPVDNTFDFSVPDPEARKQLENIPPGSSVALQYNQKLFVLDLPLPLMCRRRTQFEITGVRLAPALSPEQIPVRPPE